MFCTLMTAHLAKPNFLSLASQKSKNSTDESEADEHSCVSDASLPQNKQNGDVGSNQHGTRRRANTKENGERSLTFGGTT